MNKILSRGFIFALLFAVPTASFAAALSDDEQQQVHTISAQIHSLRDPIMQGSLTAAQQAQLSDLKSQMAILKKKMQS